MGISGTDLAGLPARFGVARFGAFRFGGYYPNLTIQFIFNGTVRTSQLILESLEIDERVSAHFTMRAGFTITDGSRVSLAIGDQDSPGTILFQGTIVDYTRRQAQSSQAAQYDITCLANRRLLDAPLLTTEFESTATGTAIAQGIIAAVATAGTSGASGMTGFTANHVQGDIPSLGASFKLINERASSALDRLAKLTGAKPWYLDENDDLHFFLDESGSVPNPTALTSANTYFWDFQSKTDWSQIRTCIMGEGRRTQVLLDVPAGETSIPVEDSSIVPISTAGGAAGKVRFGTQLLTYTHTDNFEANNGAVLGTNVRTATAAGATSLPVDDVDFNTVHSASSEWARVGDQVIRFTSVTGGGTPSIDGIPASGYGSIAFDIQAGTQVSIVGTIRGIPASGTGAILVAQSAGEEVVLRNETNDTTAASNLAAIEGRTGNHSALVSSDRSNYDALVSRNLAELDVFGAAVVSVSYKTRDPNHTVGRTVTVTNVGGVTGDFVIQTVRLTGFDSLAPWKSHTPKVFPVRDVLAIPVRLANFNDFFSPTEDAA